jgi:hypothetical protein
MGVVDFDDGGNAKKQLVKGLQTDSKVNIPAVKWA